MTSFREVKNEQISSNFSPIWRFDVDFFEIKIFFQTFLKLNIPLWIYPQASELSDTVLQLYIVC